MSSSPDNFESLEKLLRLKRHEPPPPRYFNEFSGRVIDRLGRGEGRLSWWDRLGFDLRPALAAGAGMAACGLIVYGVATTDGDAGPVSAATYAGNFFQAAAPMEDPTRSVAANSTNPVPIYGTPSDKTVFRSSVMPVSFQGQ
jgi:hypothetical protein